MESQVEQPVHTNGMSDIEDEERTKMRPVDIDADVREMERRKRVENIMNSKLFREELERIIESQLRDGSGPSGLLQQISDMVGVNKQSGNMFKSSSCVVPVNDIRGIEAMGYAKGEKILRCKLACLYRLIDLYGWSYGSNTLITARLNQDDEQFLINPYGLLFHEVTASSLIKVDMQGTVIEQGTTNFSVNITAYSLHAAVHSARPDIKCIIHVHTPAVVAVSSLKHGLMPLSQESVVIGEVSTHFYLGGHLDPEEKDKLARNLGPNNKVLLLTNQGALCCGETIEEAFYNARNTVLASEIQLKLMPVGIDNLVQIDDETKKKIYDAAHKPPESTPRPDQPSVLEGKVERKWRVGGVEFEALMRMLDNAGFRTGYIYRHPLVKGEPPKPKNDVEVPPAVSSLGYLLEEEELYRQGLWRKLEGGRKGNDRSRWLNSPNTYQKVEVLETGTADPKKITKWVAEGSPNHSSSAPVRIDSALQFVPKGTNPKEFKQRQQQIKDYRRADKISAGPQSHILEGVTWEEAKKMQDATVTQTGDHVVLMGAASKGIIQRGHQHNAMVYKSPYAKNPFDNITDDEINEYKKVVEKKTKGEYDTDYSESEGLSSAALNKRIDAVHIRSPTSVTSETEEESHDEPQILRIETKTVPVASQPEVVLSDGSKSENRQQYRTNSHSGLPKGSYLDPKPIHFHIARKNEVSAICIKKFIELPRKKSSNYMYKQPLKTSVTINIKTDKSLSLKIPFDTVREFISPFVKVLNCNHIANSTDEESQTSYISYSPLSITDNNTFEKQILDQMKEQLLAEVFDNSECEDEWEKDIFKDIQNITQFDENDQENNEQLSEFPDDIKSIILSSDESENEQVAILNSDESENEQVAILSSDESENEQVIILSSDESDNEQVVIFSSDESANDEPKINEEELVDRADSFFDKLNKMTESHFEVAEGVFKEVKNILQQINSEEALNSSLDEGIEDCTLINEIATTDVNNTSSDVIKKIADLIVNYMIRQCLEVNELILCPEVLYDSNVNKLLDKLKQIYKDFYEDSLSDEQKNDLRVSLFSFILNKLEVEEELNNSDDSIGSNTISDKIYTLSEFLNDILDHFFNLIGKPDSDKTFVAEEMCHSTPEGTKQIKPGIISPQSEQDIEITAFHQKTLTKSGSDLFWISVSPYINKKRPTHLLQSSCEGINILSRKTEVLSPIQEEARINLFDTFDEKEFDNIIKEEGSNPVENMDEKSYVNVVLSDKTNEYRQQDVTDGIYNKKNIVICSDPDNKENNSLDNSDNWLGYEAAKF